MYLVEYRWIKKPTPVTTNDMVALSASSENAILMGIENPSPSPETLNQFHAVQTKRAGRSPCCASASIEKPATHAMNETPTAPSAISVTASLPIRLPNTPLMSAPSNGNAKITPSSAKSVGGKTLVNSCMSKSLPELHPGSVGPTHLAGPKD